MSRWIACLVPIAILLAAAPPGLAEEGDHPLISRYPGSKLSRTEVKDYDEYPLILGLNEDNTPSGRTIAGKVTRLSYYHPQGRSKLEIYRNYEQALRAAGMETLFECADKECGPAYAASSWNRFNGITAKTGADCRYLAGKLAAEGGTAYVSLMVGKTRTQIDVVEIKEMEGERVHVDATALGGGLDRVGHVEVPGIFFDFGKSALKDESAPALEEIAKLLGGRPELRVFVVGHTDIVGDLATNRELSAARARTVVEALVERHGIDRARLEAHGVGPLAPVATNATDEGRARNRRVELVAR